MSSFWDCERCKAEYKKKVNHFITVGDVAQALEEQDFKHRREHEQLVLKHSPNAQVYNNDGIQIDTQEYPYSNKETELEK